MAQAAETGDQAAAAPVPRGLLLLLVAMTAVAPLAMQIFVPALPAIQRGFEVTTGVAQLALSLSILSNAFATLSYGPLSDRFGRRPVVLAGFVLFVVGSVMCVLAPTIGLLVVGRIVQAAGGAAGMVIGRAIVRDLYDREQAASVLAYLTMAMVMAPMLAPVFGALLIDTAGWRSIFFVLTIVGLVVTWATARHLVETRVGTVGGAGWGRLLTDSIDLMRSRAFIGYVLQCSFAMGMFFSFISGAPYIVIEVLGLPATAYGLYFIMVSAGYMAGNFTTARIGRKVGLDRMIVIGSILGLLGTLLSLGLMLSLPWAALLLFGPMMAVAYSNGLAIPNAQAGAMSVNPALAGTASGVSGFSQMAVSAALSQLVGMVQDGTPYPTLAFMVGCAALSLLGFVLARPWKRG